MPEVNVVLNLLGLLLGGGAFVGFLNYRTKMRQLENEKAGADALVGRVNFDTILSEMRKQRDEAWSRVEEYEQRIERLEVEITGLRVARDLDPFPNWIVASTDFTYLYVNREFERVFLTPEGKAFRDIIGKKHEDFWPVPFCRTLYSLNDAAKARPDGTARATTELEIPRIGLANVTVHKFPVKAQPSGAIVGWAGYITGIDPAGRVMG